MADQKFLVMRLGSLGDIVHAFPAVAALRESFANAEIIWVTHPKWQALVRSSNLANDIWTVDTRDWTALRGILARIRRHHFETAIDYQGLWKSASIPFLTRVAKRIGFSSDTIREAGVPLFYTDRVRVNPATHMAEDQASTRRRLEAHGIAEYVVLSPGGGWRSKCWPAERFGKLASRISQELKLHCVINAGPGEEDLVRGVIAAAEGSQPVAYSGNLGELMALLKNACAVVAGDTGPLHLADALRAPVAAIFGPTDPARNGPYWHSGVVLRWEGAETTYKRGSVPDRSLLHVSVDEVLSALRGLRGSA